MQTDELTAAFKDDIRKLQAEVSDLQRTNAVRVICCDSAGQPVLIGSSPCPAHLGIEKFWWPEGRTVPLKQVLEAILRHLRLQLVVNVTQNGHPLEVIKQTAPKAQGSK